MNQIQAADDDRDDPRPRLHSQKPDPRNEPGNGDDEKALSVRSCDKEGRPISLNEPDAPAQRTEFSGKSQRTPVVCLNKMHYFVTQERQ
jgi:hypothetical protein